MRNHVDVFFIFLAILVVLGIYDLVQKSKIPEPPPQCEPGVGSIFLSDPEYSKLKTIAVGKDVAVMGFMDPIRMFVVPKDGAFAHEEDGWRFVGYEITDVLDAEVEEVKPKPTKREEWKPWREQKSNRQTFSQLDTILKAKFLK